MEDGRRMLAEGRAADAEALFAEAVQIWTALWGPGAPDPLAARTVRARALRRLGRTAEAEAELRAVIAVTSATAALLPLDGSARLLLAGILLSSQRAREALEGLDALVARSAHGPQDLTGSAALTMRAAALSVLGRHAEAAEQSGEAAAGIADEYGAGHARALRARASRAHDLAQLGRYDEAEAECRALIGAAAGLDPGAASELDRSARGALVFSLVGLGRALEAEAEARAAIRSATTVASAARSYPVTLQLGLARALNAQGRHEEALDTARSAEAAYVGTADARPQFVAAISLAVATAQLALGRPDEARHAADRALAGCRATLGPYHHRTLEAGTLHGMVLAAEGSTAAAREQLAPNAAAWREHFGADHPGTRTAEASLAALG
ncbi:tetratricopeptide repeat protein [Kitasatospora sp. NPDC094015]|uniref:tetratricopeptide repeat protein n=1 Tax=Kitasatospora sp. NPDC094015 TaxID=3155205 RepID=UPI0033185E09